jgi:myo-inositol-1(or 4)-monophosphatase
MDLVELRGIAARAAARGSKVVRERAAHTLPGRAVAEKGAGDYVTEVDVASERAIAELLRDETPDVPVLGEEGGGAALGAGRAWVVDPLDGTTNFVHGFPLVGVSVALVENGRPVAGAVEAPLLGERWIASRGAGAFAVRTGDEATVRLSVSRRDPARAVIATGFPFRHKEVLPRYVRAMEEALRRFEDLRRPGAAALDLAWVAAGVFDGFFELRLSAWDVAAGALLIEEAGGVVTDWEGGDDYLGGNILAGSAAIHAELREVTRR